MKQPVTALRLSRRIRMVLERMADQTGHSMTECVEYLIDGAADHLERWPRRQPKRPPPRGAAWRSARA